VIGNESADAIAKYAALHKYGHDEAFAPPLTDGNPFFHITGLLKRTMRLLTLPLESALDHNKSV